MEWQLISPNNMPQNEEDILVSMINLETGKEFIEVGHFIRGHYESYSECGDAEVIPIAYCPAPECFFKSKNLNSVEVAKTLRIINEMG
jgi:hypothetical protein